MFPITNGFTYIAFLMFLAGGLLGLEKYTKWKIFKWDLCMVSTASLANIGGSASAPIVATAYDPNFAGIGVLMGVLGAAIDNFFGLGMGALLQIFVK